MAWWLWTIIGVYVVGFVLAFWMNTHLPVTFGLALLRSFLWPFWIAGLIHGVPQQMD